MHSGCPAKYGYHTRRRDHMIMPFIGVFLVTMFLVIIMVFVTMFLVTMVL